jgi:hypothetical protein
VGLHATRWQCVCACSPNKHGAPKNTSGPTQQGGRSQLGRGPRCSMPSAKGEWGLNPTAEEKMMVRRKKTNSTSTWCALLANPLCCCTRREQ